jgi:Glycosyl hydrolases family 38 N-terminal domain.
VIVINAAVKTVHIVFKTHLDIGFTDLAANVLDQYVHSFIPKAIELAERTKDDAERFIWTTGSWLIRYYLEHAAPEETRKMEEAIRKGHIVWHGLPFTTHTELMDKKLFEFGLSITSRLDKTFGKQTIGAKMTDVPGHTIGMVPLLAAAGIRYLHLGTNPASKAPDVPPAFVWRAADGSEIIVNYDDSYGAAMVIPGFEDALYFAHTLDNVGPQSLEEIHRLYRDLAEQYPNAVIKASTLDDYADRIWSCKSSLPVVTEEIGDSWIHGAASDPSKIAAYRELLRLRDKWIEEGRLIPETEEFDSFNMQLLLIPEHTWGLEVKKFLPDFVHYAKPEFQAARDRDVIGDNLFPLTYEFTAKWSSQYRERTGKPSFSYSEVERSWDEQRSYVRAALQALSPDKRAEAQAAVNSLTPTGTAVEQYEPIAAGRSYHLVQFEVVFGEDGSICYLEDRNGKVWSSEQSRIGRYFYETFGLADYQRWYEQYHTYWDRNADWVAGDFGKPGMEFANPRPEHRRFSPRIESIRTLRTDKTDRVLVKLRMPDEAAVIQGAPRVLELSYSFAKDRTVIDIELDWFDKDAHRLPEASWFTVAPLVNNPNLWKMEKLGAMLSPLEVVKDGNRSMHAVQSLLAYSGSDGSASIQTLDAPLVSMGQPRLLQFDNTFADLTGGLHFNLHNNIWGTNFRMWYEEDSKFRFSLELKSN